MIGDNEVMASTVVEGSTLKYVLPDGQVVQGTRPEQMNAAAIQAWCDHVRSNIEAVHNKARQRKPREDSKQESAPRSEPSPQSSDPLEYAQAMYEQALNRCNYLFHELERVQDEEDAARKDLEKWKKIKEALNET